MFKDLTGSEWFYSFAEECYRQGIVTGYPGETFFPTHVELTPGERELMIRQVAIAAKQQRQWFASHGLAAKRLREQVMPAVVKVVDLVGLTPMGSGSGIVVHPSGWVITNDHVVVAHMQRKAAYTEGPKPNLEVEFTDGPYAGHKPELRILATDPDNDLAIGKLVWIDGQEREHPWVRLADSEEQPGEPVVMMGAPMGVAGWEAHGVVAREEFVAQYWKKPQSLIAVAGVINPGNSGGALIRASDGALLGINSMKIVDPTVEGMGFAIHHRDVRRLMDQWYCYQPQ